MSVMVLNGLYPDGDPYGTFLLDSTAGGGGAYADHDGLTASGDFCVPRPAIANVESHEADGQILFLYRGILPDSGGPGRQRGGSTVGLALTPHGTDQLQAMLVGHGVEVPNSSGIFGGMEGSCNRNELLHRVEGVSPVGMVTSAADHESWVGEREIMNAKPGFFTLRRGDAVSYSFQGGGGYGDPLDRDPELVVHDVATRQVSRRAARAIYGVDLDDALALDVAATEARRSEIRMERLGATPTTTAVPTCGADEAGEPSADGRPLTPELAVAGDGHVHCSCGHDFGAGPDWKAASTRRTVRPGEHGPLLRLHEELELREYVCPSCGRLLESNVSRTGSADLTTSELT